MTMMEAVRSCFENFATFSGRARRAEFWKFHLFNALADFACTLVGLLLSALFQSLGTAALVLGLVGLYNLVTIIPSLSVSVRRLHDIGKSGACLFFLLLPVIGDILFLVWTFQSGQYGDNQYGPDPKSRGGYGSMTVRSDYREKEQEQRKADREQRRADRAAGRRDRREDRGEGYSRGTEQRDRGRGRGSRGDEQYARRSERGRRSYSSGSRGGERSFPLAVVIAIAGAIALLLILLLLVFGGSRKAVPRSNSGRTARTETVKAGYSNTADSLSYAAPTEHIHSWSPATCVRPATCTICGTTQGSALGHSWSPATYTQPRTCTVCGETEGGVLQAEVLVTAAPVYTNSSKSKTVQITEAPAPTLSPNSTVELFTENKSYSKAFAARVAHSPSLSACESVVKKLRSAGYNAYLYEIPGEGGYAINIGVFQSVNEAETMSQYLHDQPEVKGAALDRAFSVNVYLSDAAARSYANPYW